MDMTPPEIQPKEKKSFEPPMEADWHRMIAEAAYFRAERRGFAPGQAIDDWLLAEQQIREHLQSGHGGGRGAPAPRDL